jgi:hypothetical protein
MRGDRCPRCGTSNIRLQTDCVRTDCPWNLMEKPGMFRSYPRAGLFFAAVIIMTLAATGVLVGITYGLYELMRGDWI